MQSGDQELKGAQAFCQSVRDRLPRTTPEQKRDFLKLVVERVAVNSDNTLDIQVIIPKPDNSSCGCVCETAFS